MLCDRLVCGIGDSRIQKRLLAEPNLTLDKALELALVQESAEQNAAQLQACKHPRRQKLKLTSLEVTQTPKQSNGKKSFGACHRCGGKHMQKDCPFKEAECHKCKKKGHLAQVCRSKTKQTQLNAAPQQARAQNSTHHMEEIETTDEQSTYTLFHVTPNNYKAFLKHVCTSMTFW